MDKLIKAIESLKKSEISKTIDTRMGEFRAFRKKPGREIFKELCFCILTANSTAERCITVQEKMGDGLLSMPQPEMQKKLRDNGCRFHTKRSEYISEAREHAGSLRETLSSFKNSTEAREWLAENIKGIGYKEASHFLRNIGYDDLAIVDFHIVDILNRHGLAESPKTMTKNAYLKIENTLKGIAEKTGLSLAELDLYLWYMETGKVLK